MKLLFSTLFLCFVAHAGRQCPAGNTYTLLAHGGAGDWNVSAKSEDWFRARFEEALTAGVEILKAGGTSLDAVQATVQWFEDSGAFNSGKGAVRNSEKVVELDASIMDGETKKAGAVAAVKTIRNPIAVSRLVMEKTWHVLLAAGGAEKFAEAQGLVPVDASYFKRIGPTLTQNYRYGTVGAVALDCFGHLAAATSTGGLEGKMPGRVGDSPLIGSGTYADDSTVAVSGTGEGEYFIRANVARDIAARMEYQKSNVGDAAQAALDQVAKLGGSGGVIALDRSGKIATPFNTSGMLRGVVRETGDMKIEFH